MDFLQNILKRERGNERLATKRNKYVELYRREKKMEKKKRAQELYNI